MPNFSLPKLSISFNNTSYQKVFSNCCKGIKENKVKSALVASVALTACAMLASSTLRAKAQSNLNFYYIFMKAQLGNHEYQYKLSQLYASYGKGYEKQHQYYLSKAALGGFGWSWKKYRKESPVEARGFLKEFADREGNEKKELKAEAAYQYALMCEKGLGGSKEVVEARKYYDIAASQGDARAANRCALLCFNGTGGPKDLNLAKKYFLVATNGGIALASYSYVIACREDKNDNTGSSIIKAHLKKAVEAGGKVARFLYAEALRESESVEEKAKGLSLYKELADEEENFNRQHARACFRYAKIVLDSKSDILDLGCSELNSLLAYAEKARNFFTRYPEKDSSQQDRTLEEINQLTKKITNLIKATVSFSKK